MKAKNSSVLAPYIKELIGKFNGGLCRNKVQHPILTEQRERILRLERKYVPETAAEFRNSPHYCILSQLKRYQGLQPRAKPLFELFNGEEVYPRAYVTELHTPERWLKYRRQVKEGERPLKCVRGMYRDQTKVAELHGYWQTEPFCLRLTSEGNIPRNKYGNIETFNGPLPPECKYLNLPRIIPVCKNLGLEFVPAVVGFDLSSAGFHPVVKGVVVFRQDTQNIVTECKRQEEITKKRA